MDQQTPEAEKAFLARQLVQVTLPHSSPGNVPIWKRKNGNLTLSIRPGWDHAKDEPIGYPFGSIPRLLLFWITTETLRTKSRRLELGDTLAVFMRELGLDPGRGGPRSDAWRLRDQMDRLFRATISFDYQQTEGPRQNKQWIDMQVATKGEFWWDIRQPDQSTIWGSWIELGENFHNALITAPVPVDMRALRALKQSPMALDFYSFATWRAFVAAKSGNVQFVPWRSLAQQMGSDYSDISDFRKKAKSAFRKVLSVYPGLKLDFVEGGLSILPTSQPAVSRRLPTRKLPTESGG